MNKHHISGPQLPNSGFIGDNNDEEKLVWSKMQKPVGVFPPRLLSLWDSNNVKSFVMEFG